MKSEVLIQSILALFMEAYSGPPDPRTTWFTDNEPDSGILGILKSVSAAEASWSSNNNNPGTTIAAHVEHLRWSLANANRALQGEEYQGKWAESWNMLEADEVKWTRLKTDLQNEFSTLLENLSVQTELDGEYLTGVMALIPHAAYHLGTIRQLIERAREQGESRVVSTANVNNPILELRVALASHEYDQLVKFYCAGLGLEPAQVWNNGQGKGLVLEMGAATLELFDEAQARIVDQIEVGRYLSGPVRLALQVPDLKAAIVRLLAAGATQVADPVVTPWRDTNVRFQDPDGLQLTLYQKP